MRPLFVIASLVAALLPSARLNAAVSPGDTFPDLGGFELAGTIPSDLKGKVVLVDFWASWCVPCKASFPALDRLEKKHGAEGFAIIGVSVDESAKEMERFKSKNPVSFVLVHDVKQKLVAAVDAPTMPTSFLIGKDGKVIQKHAGFKGKETEDSLEKEISEALAK